MKLEDGSGGNWFNTDVTRLVELFT